MKAIKNKVSQLILAFIAIIFCILSGAVYPHSTGGGHYGGGGYRNTGGGYSNGGGYHGGAGWHGGGYYGSGYHGGYRSNGAGIPTYTYINVAFFVLHQSANSNFNSKI